MSGPNSTLRPSNYEPIPSNGESDESYIPLFNFNGKTSSSRRHHGTDVYNQPPASPISEGSVMRDDQSPAVSEELQQNPILNQRAVLSQASRDLGNSGEKSEAFPASSEIYKKHSWTRALSDWWWWELGSVLLSCACFIAIVITLWIMQEKPLSSWHSAVSPNALISTLATISRASLMLAVAACVSQLKWLYFASGPHRIQNIQIFDDASRGPLGALEFLTRLSPRELFSRQSRGAAWTLWASILTILALVSDPFAQQLLSFPTRTVSGPRDLSSASISASQIYDTGVFISDRNAGDVMVDMSMQVAIQNGLYGLNTPTNFSCSTAECRWPNIYTLGVCGSCNNVTDLVSVNCTSNFQCNYTLPSGLELAGQFGSAGAGARGPLLMATARAANSTYLESSNDTGFFVESGLVRFNQSNMARRFQSYEAFDCRLSWCAKGYSGVEVTRGEINIRETRTWPLRSSPTADVTGYVRLDRLEMSENTDFDGRNKSFVVNSIDNYLLAKFLVNSVLTATNEDPAGQALFMQPNISRTFANIADSMTNNIQQSRNATRMSGISYREETYIKVTWPWLILPGVVVLMSIVLLIASIVLSRGEKQGLWKSSLLAPLFTQMRGWEQKGPRVGRWSEMAEQARDMKGVLRRDGHGELEFVRQ
ncbi:hypothetical protein IQ07DRAFT_573045 [Pyrenochaeta sp. DS3sAY3a]|nr:hypothetical protein IQ07DRAFT_573045 [Pyrenochaeta sp. DS3sAY3a]